jgi:hypothetical protein
MKYHALVLETKAIIDDIQSTHAIPADLGSIQSGLRAKYASIAVDDDNPPRKKLLEEVQADVQRQYPAGVFWTPTSEGAPSYRPARRDSACKCASASSGSGSSSSPRETSIRVVRRITRSRIRSSSSSVGAAIRTKRTAPSSRGAKAPSGSTAW